jgi:hypothetical protein
VHLGPRVRWNGQKPGNLSGLFFAHSGCEAFQLDGAEKQALDQPNSTPAIS